MQWTTEENTGFGFGRVIHSATTVAACQQKCLSTAECTGFDFNPAMKPTGQCWLTGPWAGQNPAHMEGVKHYTLFRKCDSTYRNSDTRYSDTHYSDTRYSDTYMDTGIPVCHT